MLRVIGLSGYARSGKDTVADVLAKNHGFTKVSFAEPMRDALLVLNPIVHGEQGYFMRLADAIRIYGWEAYKESPYSVEIRSLLQKFGTEVAREQFGEDFWVNLAIKRALEILNVGGSVVFTDVRFLNEVAAVHNLHGEVWRVRRPNVFPANAHASETSLDDFEFDSFIDNNGSLGDLELIVDGHF